MNYREIIEEKLNEINRLGTEIEHLREEWIAVEHPLSIGQQTTVNDYAYKGKPMVVARLDVKRINWANKHQWYWFAEGPGSQEGRFRGA